MPRNRCLQSYVMLLSSVVLPSSGAVAQTPASDEQPPAPDYVRVPAGWLHKSCVTEVPNGASVEEDSGRGMVVKKDGVVVLRVPKCPYPAKLVRAVQSQLGPIPAFNGWIEYSYLYAPPNPTGKGQYFVGAVGNWTVPTPPCGTSSCTGATIYFYNALQPASQVALLQPVLQWGPSMAGGGLYWAIASWYVVGNNGLHSTLVPVSTNHNISGNMGASSCNSSGVCNWHIATSDTTNGSSTSFDVSTSTSFVLAEPAVMEAFTLSSCSQLPQAPNTVFTSTYLYEPGNAEVATNATWQKFVTSPAPAGCTYSVSNFSRGTTLNY